MPKDPLEPLDSLIATDEGRLITAQVLVQTAAEALKDARERHQAALEWLENAIRAHAQAKMTLDNEKRNRKGGVN